MSELTLPYEEYESVDLTEDERSSEENFTDEGSPLNFVNCTLDCTTEETFSSTFAGSSPLTCANKIVPRRPLKQSVRFKNVPNVIKKSETITSQPILSEKKVKKLSPIKPRSNILAETQDIVDVDSKTTESVCVADKEILSEILPTQNVPIRYQIAQNNIQNQTIYSQKQPGKVVIIKKNNKYYKIVIPHNVMPNINQSTGPVLINIPEVGPLVIRSDPHVTKQNSVPVDQPFSLNLDVHQSQTKNSITPKKVPEISWKETALCDKKFCWTFSKGKKRDLEGFSYNDRLGFNRTEYQKARKCSGILNSIVKKKRTEIIDQMHKFNMFKDSVNKINEEKIVKKKPARGRASKKSITKTKFKVDGSTSPPLLTENFKKTHMSLEPMSYDPQNIHCPANETEDDTDYDCDLLMTKKVVILNGRDTKPIAKKRKSKSTHLTRPKRKISNKVKLKRLWAKKLAQHKEIVANDNKVFMLKPCYVEMVRDESVEEAYRNYMRNIGFRRPKTNTNVPRTIQRSTQLGTNCGEYFSDTIQIFKSRVITSVEEFKKEINFLKPLLIVNEHNLGIVNYSSQFAKSNIIYIVEENTSFPVSILRNEDFVSAFELGYLKFVDAQLFCKYVMSSAIFNKPSANKHVSDHNYCRSKNKRI